MNDLLRLGALLTAGVAIGIEIGSRAERLRQRLDPYLRPVEQLQRDELLRQRRMLLSLDAAEHPLVSRRLQEVEEALTRSYDEQIRRSA